MAVVSPGAGESRERDGGGKPTTEVETRAARALGAGATSGMTRSVPKEPPREDLGPEKCGVSVGSSAAHASARLYAPPTMRQNINATTENALVAATLAASAPTPDPYPVYAVDEDGNELLDDPPVRVVPMRRRLTVPRGLLGAYEIVARLDAPEDPATDAEDEPEDTSDGARGRDGGGAVALDAKTAKPQTVFDLRCATATKDAVLRHARATCPGGLAAAPLTRELYAGDAERDAAVLLARATHDGRTQAARLRERERKLGLLPKKCAERKRKRGASGRGSGSGRGRGSGLGYRYAAASPNDTNASSGVPVANPDGDSDDASPSGAESLSAEDAPTDEDESQWQCALATRAR